MTKVSNSLLGFVNENTKEGEFKIFGTSELLGLFPEKDDVTFDIIKEEIDKLQIDALLTCKYADKNSFCLTSTSKGKLFKEKKTVEQKQTKSRSRFMWYNLFSSAVGAFIGAAVAILVLIPFIL